MTRKSPTDIICELLLREFTLDDIHMIRCVKYPAFQFVIRYTDTSVVEVDAKVNRVFRHSRVIVKPGYNYKQGTQFYAPYFVKVPRRYTGCFGLLREVIYDKPLEDLLAEAESRGKV